MSRNNTLQNRLTLLCVLSLWIGFILGCGSLSKPSASTRSPAEEKQYQNRKALEGKTDEFSRMPSKVQLVKEPVMKGKMAFYRHLGETWYLENFDDTYKDKSKMQDLFAKGPDEVGTIVLEPDCPEIRSGNYNISAGYTLPAFVERCEVDIVDPTTSALIYKKQFQGALQANIEVRKDQTKVVAEVQKDEIYDFLTGLPRK